jgi:hypothetical protein
MIKPRSYLKGIFFLYFYFNGLLMAAFIAKHQKNVVTSGAQANVHAFAFGAFSSASNPTCLREILEY